MTFVDGRGMQADGLIVGNISETFTILNQQLRVETPCNDRACDDIIIAVGIGSQWNVKELSPLARVA